MHIGSCRSDGVDHVSLARRQGVHRQPLQKHMDMRSAVHCPDHMAWHAPAVCQRVRRLILLRPQLHAPLLSLSRGAKPVKRMAVHVDRLFLQNRRIFHPGLFHRARRAVSVSAHMGTTHLRAAQPSARIHIRAVLAHVLHLQRQRIAQRRCVPHTVAGHGFLPALALHSRRAIGPGCLLPYTAASYCPSPPWWPRGGLW